MASILKVNTIQDATNSTTSMTIDSTGRILTPARPSFFAHRKDQGNQSISATTNTLVQFNQTDHNIGSHFDTSTYKFTCPVSGVYHFDTHLYIYSTDSAEARFYVYDSSFQKQTTTGAWRRNESERLTTFYLKQALVDIHNLKARVSALESS